MRRGFLGVLTLSDAVFITGTPKDVAQIIIEQCQTVGAWNFRAVAPIGVCWLMKFYRLTNCLAARPFRSCGRRGNHDQLHIFVTLAAAHGSRGGTHLGA